MQPACRLKIGNNVSEQDNLPPRSFTNECPHFCTPSVNATRPSEWRQTSKIQLSREFKLLADCALHCKLAGVHGACLHCVCGVRIRSDPDGRICFSQRFFVILTWCRVGLNRQSAGSTRLGAATDDSRVALVDEPCKGGNLVI